MRVIIALSLVAAFCCSMAMKDARTLRLVQQGDLKLTCYKRGGWLPVDGRQAVGFDADRWFFEDGTYLKCGTKSPRHREQH